RVTRIRQETSAAVLDANATAVVPSAQARPFDGFGDLVLLQNPALEAELYHNMNELVQEIKELPDAQPPIFVTISSEGDTRNAVLFPVGRMLSTVPQTAQSAEQWQSMIQSVGTFEPYRTHRLVSKEQRPKPKPAPDGCVCESRLIEDEEHLVSD